MPPKNDSVEAKKLKGFRDFPPEEAALRQKICDKIIECGSRAGFQLISTPSIEYAEVLLGSGGNETDKEVYRFLDHGERPVALRYDLTIGFARFVAEHLHELVLPFKKMQIGEVWRGEKPQKGRYRQFCQGDFDIIGADSYRADVEVIVGIVSVLKDLVPGAFTVYISNRKILSGLIKTFFPKITDSGEKNMLIALDKLRKIGSDKVKAVIAEDSEIGPGNFDKLMAVLDPADKTADTLAMAKSVLVDSSCKDEVVRLEKTIEIIQASRPKDALYKVVVDLSTARGLAYYTGIVFETLVDQMEALGSISSGGRYDGLVSRFLGEEQNVPGVGGSVGVDRLLAVLAEIAPAKAPTVKAFVAIADEAADVYAFRIAAALRASGISCDVATKAQKLGQQFRHASRLEIPFVITVGEDEVKSNTFAVKNMVDRSEEKGVPFADLIETMKRLM
ncbi:MAG: histidine--tRNA ligase [Oligoflexales bacterium]